MAGAAIQTCWMSAAFAQETEAAPAPAVAANDQSNEDIVITAQRREQRLQDVPIAVTAITADAALRQGVRGVDDIQVATPALSITRVNQTPLFYLRGVGTQNQLPNEEPSIPLYIDGFYASAGAGSALALNNIERIEVLRGPQGTLFGRNGTGGLINIITRTPSYEPTVSMMLGYGNYDTIEGSFYGSTGITDGIAADLALYYTRRGDGFGRNRLLNTDVGLNREFAGRTKILLEPSDSTRVTLTGEYSNTRSDYGMTTQLVPGILGFDGVTRRAGPQDITANIDPYTTPRTWAITARLDQDLSFGRFVSMTQYRDNRTYYQKDVDGIAENRGTAQQREYTRYATQEIQFQSLPSSPVQWVLGAFYFAGSGGVDPLVIGGSQFGPTIASQVRYGNVDSQSYAAFAQATIPVVDSLNLTIGGRYTHDRKELSGRVFNNLPNGTTAVVIPSADSTLTSGKFTYRIALDYRAADDVLLYAVHSRGYKAGSFNVLALADPAVQPETLNAYEIGAKTDWFDRRLRLNFSAYYYDYQDIQLSQLFSATAGGSGGIKILNATSAEIYGAEVEAQVRLGGLTLSANLAYTHGRYGTFLGAPFSFPLPYNCTTGLPTGPTQGRNAQCTGDASGNEVVRTTPFTSTLSANYDIPIGSNTLSLSASWYHNDGFPWEVDNRVREPSYDIVNADVRYRFNEHYTVRLWARNLFDEQYRVGISTSNNDQGAPGAPRTYGASFMVNF
jgi:iron complex outermembrane receptor protein